MSTGLSMLIAENQNFSGDVSSLQRAREHGTLVQCLCIYLRFFVRFPPLAAFSNHHERAGSCSFPRVTSFPCSLNLCQQKVMTYRMQREAFGRPDSCAQVRRPQCSRRCRADPHVRQFTCGGRVKLRGRVTRTGRHFGGSVLVPFRGWQPCLPLSGRQDVNRRARCSLLFRRQECWCVQNSPREAPAKLWTKLKHHHGSHKNIEHAPAR